MSQKISQMTNGNPAQANDLVPIVRAGANYAVTAASIASAANAIKGVTVDLTATETRSHNRHRRTRSHA